MSTFGYDNPGGSARGGEGGEAPGPYSVPGLAPGSPYGGGPQALLPTDPTAVLGRRIVAWLVDTLLFSLLMLLFSILGPFGSYAPIPEEMTGERACEIIRDQEGVNTCFPLDEGMLGAFPSQDRAYYVSDIVTVLGMLAAVAWFVLIYVVWQGSAGATPGKWLLKVRVMDENGLPPGLGRSTVRSLLWVADAAPYIFPLVGLVTGLMSTGHRRVGDMAAGTYVVGLDHVGVPVQIPGDAPSQPALHYESPVQGMPAAGAGPGPGPAGYPAPVPPASPPPGAPPGPAPSQPTAPLGPAPVQPSAFVPAPSPADAPGPSPAPEPTSLPPFDPAADAPTPAGSASPPSSTEHERPDPSSPFSSLSSWPERTGHETDPPVEAGEPSQPASGEPGVSEQPESSEASAQPIIPVEPTRPPIATGPPQAGIPGQESSQAQPQTQPQPEGQTQQPQPGTAAGGEGEPEPSTEAEPLYQPQWDAARGAYIQWDPDRGSWLQWDDTAQQWHRI